MEIKSAFRVFRLDWKLSGCTVCVGTQHTTLTDERGTRQTHEPRAAQITQ